MLTRCCLRRKRVIDVTVGERERERERENLNTWKATGNGSIDAEEDDGWLMLVVLHVFFFFLQLLHCVFLSSSCFFSKFSYSPTFLYVFSIYEHKRYTLHVAAGYLLQSCACSSMHCGGNAVLGECAITIWSLNL